MRIIYVDDDAVNRTVACEMLKLGGVECIEAADAIEGLEVILRLECDLVLMDIRMPKVNGLTAIRQIRSQAGPVSKLPIIVVTADLSSGARELCIGAGADGFLEKPVSMPQLFETIAAVAARSGIALAF